jgi:hypothetical protein
MYVLEAFMTEEVKKEIELNECMDCGEEIPADDNDGSGACEECRYQAKQDKVVTSWDLADDWYIEMRSEGNNVYTYWLVDGIRWTEINFTDTDLGKIIDLGVDHFNLNN